MILQSVLCKPFLQVQIPNFGHEQLKKLLPIELGLHTINRIDFWSRCMQTNAEQEGVRIMSSQINH